MITVGPSGPAPFQPLSSFAAHPLSFDSLMLTHEDLADIIAGMNELELSRFMEILALKLGASSDTLMLRLEDPGDKKIAVIKEIRDATGVKLIDAKNMTNSAPVNILAGPAWRVRDVAARLRQAGATVTVN